MNLKVKQDIFHPVSRRVFLIQSGAKNWTRNDLSVMFRHTVCSHLHDSPAGITPKGDEDHGT